MEDKVRILIANNFYCCRTQFQKGGKERMRILSDIKSLFSSLYNNVREFDTYIASQLQHLIRFSHSLHVKLEKRDNFIKEFRKTVFDTFEKLDSEIQESTSHTNNNIYTFVNETYNLILDIKSMERSPTPTTRNIIELLVSKLRDLWPHCSDKPVFCDCDDTLLSRSYNCVIDAYKEIEDEVKMYKRIRLSDKEKIDDLNSQLLNMKKDKDELEKRLAVSEHFNTEMEKCLKSIIGINTEVPTPPTTIIGKKHCRETILE